MNIRGKTIADVTRDPESEALRLHFTDGSGATFDVDGFRLIRMVLEYPVDKQLAERLKLPTPSALDTQVGGDHYKKFGAHQPWEVLATWMTPEELKGAMKRDVISYLAREADKGGRVDIEKAAHTLQIYLELSK